MNNEKAKPSAEQNSRPVRSVRIQTMNYVMIAASILLYVLILHVTLQVSDRYQTLVKNTEIYIACSENAFSLKERSDSLTEQVRLYVMTTEARYRDAYLEELHSDIDLENTLEKMENYRISEDSLNFLRDALAQSDKLTVTELYSIRLTGEALGYGPENFFDEVKNISLTEEDQKLSPKDKISKAQDLVFNSDYQNSKERIKNGITSCLDSIVLETLKEQELSASTMEQTLILHRIHISLLLIVNILTFLMIFFLVVKPLRLFIRCIKEEKKLAVTGSYEFRYLALTYNDIYNVNAANEETLRYKAEHDPLTGAINRGAFERLRQILSNEHTPLALLLVDVDQFKGVNDTYGHEIGDAVLKKVTRLLQDNFRSNDLVARIGGDEFAVIATNVTKDQQDILIQKQELINRTLSEPDDGLPKVSLSIGIAFSADGFPEDLYRRSDKALYHVKNHGRSGCAVFEDLEDPQ